MARATIGRIDCPFHARPIRAEVRRDKNDKLYFFCPAGCGIVNPHGGEFQEFMLSNAVIFGPEGPEVENAKSKHVTRRTSGLQREDGCRQGRKKIRA